MNRRGFLLGLGAALAAPAIVPYASLMPVKLVDFSSTGWRLLAPGDRYYWNIYGDYAGAGAVPEFRAMQYSMVIPDWETAHELDVGNYASLDILPSRIEFEVIT